MIVGAMRRSILTLSLWLVLVMGACAGAPVDPLQLDRNLLRVSNRSSADWTHVEIWLNTHYRITTPVIAAHTTFTANLDSFVAGYGQRFDFRRMQVKDLRLSATAPNGSPIELRKQFEESGVKGLVSAFGGKK